MQLTHDPLVAPALPVAAAAGTTEQLGRLLEQAATSGPVPDDTGPRFAAEAAQLLARLIRAGVVPDHLAVRPGEPAVVVERTLAVAWRHATAGRSS